MARVVAFEDLPLKGTAASMPAADVSAARHDGVPATAAKPPSPSPAQPQDAEGRQHPRGSVETWQHSAELAPPGASQPPPQASPATSAVGKNKQRGDRVPTSRGGSAAEPAVRVASPAGKVPRSQLKAAAAAADTAALKPSKADYGEQPAVARVSPFSGAPALPDEPPSPERATWPAATERHSLSQARLAHDAWNASGCPRNWSRQGCTQPFAKHTS